MQVPIANTENKETFCTGIKRDTMLTFNYHQEKLVTKTTASKQTLAKNKNKQTKKLLIPFQWIRTFSHQPILTTSSRTAWLSI